MTKSFMIFSICIFLFFFSFAELKEICEENGKFPCSIVQGPISNPSTEEEMIRDFYCQFSESSVENYVSNYKWQLDNNVLGIVNIENYDDDLWQISYDQEQKRSKLTIDTSTLVPGQHLLSCKYDNELNKEGPIEEKYTTFDVPIIEPIPLSPEDKVDDMESRWMGKASGSYAPISLDGITQVDNFILYLNSSNATNYQLTNLTAKLKDIFVLPYKLMLLSPYGKKIRVYVKAHFDPIIRASAAELSHILAHLNNSVLNIELSGKDIIRVEETNLLTRFKYLNRRIRSAPCQYSAVRNICKGILSECTTLMGRVHCRALCKSRCWGSNEACYVNRGKAHCTCKKGYMLFDGRCKKQSSAYGIIFGTMAAGFVVVIIATVIITKYGCKNRKVDPKRKTQKKFEKTQEKIEKLKKKQAKLEAEKNELLSSMKKDGNFNTTFQKDEHDRTSNIYEKIDGNLDKNLKFVSNNVIDKQPNNVHHVYSNEKYDRSIY